ncbi:uncharacterized protein LOC113298414 [Papaver somniferum]|uniref:uncharacterized protein LOC113298414 n=1 Tax=Papaver somniferum TaxID=3469 RepID=UPI000E6FA8FD|nr:uncharacterized protein LOC113298414 [Papaver somniferum]
MALKRVATHVSQWLLKGEEGVRNYFADPVQNFLKYEAEIFKEGDLAIQKLERLKAEFMRLQELSAECKVKHGAAEKFTAVIVGSFVAVYAYHISLERADLQALKEENRMLLEQRRGRLADH